MDSAALDRYITGGNPHNVEVLSVCSNVECPEYGIEHEVCIRVEYGGGETPECSTCARYMETEDHEVEAVRANVKRAEELEVRFFEYLEAGYHPLDIPFSD